MNVAELDKLQFEKSVKYSVEHTWAKIENDLVVVGISDYAQDQLGEIIFVDLPQKGDSFPKDGIFGVVESAKTASDLYMPISGEIVAINAVLLDAPETINSSPFEAGWMIKVKPENESEFDGLLSSEAYRDSLT